MPEINSSIPTLCITGATGFVGSRLAAYYQSRYQVLTPSRQELSLQDPEACLCYINQHHPDFIIHCAALSDTGYCESHEEESYQVNVMGTYYLARAANSIGSRMIYLSSDQVYYGSDSALPHPEEYSATFIPNNVYGRHKLEAENRIASVTDNSIILRLTWMFDLPVRHLKTSSNLLIHILKALFTQTPLALPTHEHRGITDVYDVIRYMEQVLTLPSGVYNYGSENTYNTYQLATTFLKELSLHTYTPYIQPDTSRYLDSPKNLLMNTSKLQSQGIKFPASLQGLQQCMNNYDLSNF